MTKPFIAWDGEGKGERENSSYLLLQNSVGGVWRKNPVTIRNVIADLCQPDAWNVWYSAGYDWNMLFKNESEEIRARLFGIWCETCNRPAKTKCGDKKHELFNDHTVTIGDYEIFIFPKKIFRIKSLSDHKLYGNHYDTFGFFQVSFENSLKKWKIDIPEIITKGKSARSGGFADWSNDDIELYNQTECQLLVQMMNKLQFNLEKVGYGDLSGYHGAGAIASRMLDKLHALDYIHTPKNCWKPALASYFGGRIEMFKRGEFSNVYSYDINSAYPSATRLLPNLQNANWKWVKGNEVLDYDFGFATVTWKRKDTDIMGCFPFRGNGINYASDLIVFPHGFSGRVYPVEGNGTYHVVEVKAAIAKGLWDIDVQSAYVIENGYERPFYDGVSELMRQRLELKAKGDFANIPLRLGANSFYGKFAQTNRDKREFGQYNNFICAGYITAWTRAQLMKFAIPDELILLATDGMYSLEPLDCPIGEHLEEWEYHKYEVGRFILPGIYRIDDTVKTRGFPARTKEAFDELFWAVSTNKKAQFRTIEDKMFVGIRKSLAQPKAYPSCGFYPIKKVIDWNKSPKRVWLTNDYSEPPDLVQSTSKPHEPFKNYTLDDFEEMVQDSGLN